jgi:hypothetical protein
MLGLVSVCVASVLQRLLPYYMWLKARSGECVRALLERLLPYYMWLKARSGERVRGLGT